MKFKKLFILLIFATRLTAMEIDKTNIFEKAAEIEKNYIQESQTLNELLQKVDTIQQNRIKEIIQDWIKSETTVWQKSIEKTDIKQMDKLFEIFSCQFQRVSKVHEVSIFNTAEKPKVNFLRRLVRQPLLHQRILNPDFLKHIEEQFKKDPKKAEIVLTHCKRWILYFQNFKEEAQKRKSSAYGEIDNAHHQLENLFKTIEISIKKELLT